MFDSQSYAAIMSHDVDIVPFMDQVVSPVVMSIKGVVFGKKREKCHNVPLLFTQFQNSCISVILRVAFDKE